MDNNNQNSFTKSKRVNIGIVLFVVLVLLSLFYFLFGMRNVGKGPEILINTPPEGVVVNEPVVAIEGRVANVSEVQINGSPVLVRDGNLIKEQLVLQPGENQFEFVAKDQFGNETQKTIKIIYKTQ